jgi:hypothetical protein
MEVELVRGRRAVNFFDEGVDEGGRRERVVYSFSKEMSQKDER